MRLKGRERRHKRVRKKIIGTKERPRLSVYRSLKHIYAQLIDDEAAHTLVASSTIGMTNSGTKTEKSKMCGRILAEKALSKGIERVVFDRGGYKYHGRVKALADGAREGGLKF
ncbi:MAG TPA: 50S ribosomal protein L18 [bacterium (Candidatus Stahlbacteria)]|nr:50S ribosomal protein L18 [Candidatus Stahlbacteria bacterium]